jgi:hypothetical protein
MALGAMAALMAMVREQDAFFVMGAAVDFVWTLANDVREGRASTAIQQLKALAAGIVVFGLCVLPQAWAYFVLNGRLGPAASVSDKMQWSAPHALQVLLSPEHGLLIWTPLVFLCLAGLLMQSVAASMRDEMDGDRRRIVICLLVMFAAQVYVSGSVGTWTVAGAFGQRRFLGATVALVAGLAALLAGARGWRRAALGGAIMLSVWWNLGLMIQFGAKMMDRQRLQPAMNAYNTFVVVPRALPGLVYRYVFDRASFYQPQSDGSATRNWKPR